MRVHLGLIALSLASLGAASAEPLSVEWSAPDGCPDVNTYWKGVVGRSPHIRRASTGEPAVRARIDIRSAGDRTMATFTLRGDKREIAAETCGEIVDALALMTVLALDPDAVVSPPPEAPTAVVPAAPSPAPPPTLPIASPPMPESPPPPPPPKLRDAPYSFGVAAGGQLLSIGAQSAANGPILALDVTHGRSSGRLTLGHAESEWIRNPRGVEARFSFETARLDLCPWSWGDVFRVGVCAGLSAGAVHASPPDVVESSAQWRPWFASHLLARTELRLAGWLGLEAEVGALTPWLRPEFVGAPDYYLYQPGAFLLSSALALKVHFS